MKETTKRILSFVLCFVIVLGLMPALSLNASAAGEVIDAAIFCSDVHGNPSTVTSVFNGIKEADSTFNPTTAAFVGDTQTSASSVTSAAQSVYSGVQCIYAFGNHDDEGDYGIADFTGLSYGDSTTNYYIYTISENSMGSSNPDTSDFTNTVADLDQSKPLFIISHLPLHDRRGDSKGAATWYTAISAAAEKMDIAFFWAHNHTNEGDADIEAYYVAKDGSETITLENTNTVVTPNFTYLNAGYIDPPNTPARNNVATAVRIYENSINYTVYNASGELSGSYAVNETVTREFASAKEEETTPTETTTPAETKPKVSYILAEGTTAYTVGDDLTFNVSVNYADGTSETVTQDECELTMSCTAHTACTDVDTAMNTVACDNGDQHKVTVAYGGVDCAYLFAVGAAEELTGEAEGVVVSVSSGVVGSIAVTEDEGDFIVTAMEAKGVENYKAYDITPAVALKDGNKATVSLPIPDGVTNPVVYYVSDDGLTVTDMKAKVVDGKAVFTTNHFSTYVVGESTDIVVPDPETATGSGEVTTTTKKTVYVLTSSISSGNEYLIVNGNAAGSYYALANNSGSVAATGVTVKTDSEIGTYIELDDATDELWTASGSSSTTLKNGSYYLRCSNGSLSLSSNNSTTWTWSSSNNRLSYTSGGVNGNSVENDVIINAPGDNQKQTYYLHYSSSWGVSTSQNSVYFYVPTEIDVETTTTVSGTYSIAGEDVTKVVASGSTAELASTLTFTPADGGTATTTDTSATATYTVVEGGDPNGIIESISDNTVTFTGNYGKALVKVSYTTSFGEVTNYITVTASEPTYALQITKDGTDVTGTTVAVKGVTDGKTLQLGTIIQYVDEDGAETVELPEGAKIEWHIPEEYQNIATVDQDTGLVTFKGVDGAFYITATLTVGGKDYTVGVNISATTSQYSVPSDGATDFPEYPNEGAIRYDKTATAVGNFSQTGIAQIELSMTGVPYTTGSEIDVVIMLDMTGSMSDTAMTAAEESAIAFAEQIVKNTDGSYNDNRIAVLAFNSGSSSPYTLWSMGVVTEDTWDSFCSNVRTASDNQVSGGTPYDEALEKCQSVLQAAKTDGIGNDRQQYCVFVSDGGPTSYKYITNYDEVKAGTASAYTTSSASASGGSNQSDSNFATIATYTHEYYSTLMKDDGVTMYSVLTGLVAANYPNCTTILQNIASDSSKAYVVEDGSDTSSLTNAFTNIAMEIMQAATDVTVEDQISDDYTMIFDIPEGTEEITGVTNDFYIEFLKYELDENHERTTSTSVTKLYLKNTDGVYSAAADSTGTAYDAPVFEQTTVGDKGSLYYWSTDASDGDSDISVTVDGTTYYFVSHGMEEAGYNMTSGGYAYGTVDATTNMSDDLVIATPYFVYNASTKMLYWTVDKLDTYEYALRYFLYLDNSATEVGTSNETDPGPYPTNDHAYITYTNFNGNDCRQTFPVPQLTWNGAQVSYVFYLVNAAGQPINKSGQIVDFANATFITDIYTESVVWNKAGDTSTGTGELSANWLADDLLPDEYEIYDEQARYVLNVYENADGTTIKNQFTISGGTADEISSSLNSRLDLDTTTASVSTTKVYNTKAGQKISTYGTYDSTSDGMAGFDFANTTVAFAVVWQPRLVEDVVVVDYGLDVLINVVQNDILQNTVSGIGVGKDAYGNIAMNSGVSSTSKLGTADLTIDGNTISIENETTIRFHQGDMEFSDYVKFYYETPVEFWEGSDPTEGYMYSSVTVIPATTIYYEDNFVDYKSFTWDDNANNWVEKQENDLWSTIGTTSNATQAQDRPGVSQISGSIDADNIYGYDGAYVTMSTYSNGSSAKATVDYNNYAQAQFTFYGTGFDIISLTSNMTGTILVDVVNKTTGEEYDHFAVDTYYGYKQAQCHVLYKSYAVEDKDGNVVEGEYEWVRKEILHEADQCTGDCDSINALPENIDKGQQVIVSENTWIPCATENSIYQVPVIKCLDMPYGNYTVTIKATYESFFDHVEGSDSYDFYLDAIRIYDPANDGANNSVVEDAYKADHEGWPSYIELRNQLIEAETLGNAQTTTKITGMVFIDGDAEVGDGQIADYKSYGPNNEVYLAANQSVAFILDTPANLDRVHIGIKSADGVTGTYTIKNIAKADIDDIEAGASYNEKNYTISTTTDMYYDLTGWKNDIIVITNTGSAGIISITNIKSTYTADPDEGTAETSLYMTPEAAELVLMAMKPEPVNPFADVNSDAFFYESVLWAVENGITNGVDASHFGPFLNCNRAQVVTFLWRANGSPEPTSNVNPFTDVKESDFYYKAVLWAVENDITNGLTATTFGPNALCNRAQVVTFLWRANGSKVVDAANPFTDVPADAFYHDAVVWAVKCGITTGVTADTFNPNGECMRAHVVTFLYRAAQLRENSEF